MACEPLRLFRESARTAASERGKRLADDTHGVADESWRSLGLDVISRPAPDQLHDGVRAGNGHVHLRRPRDVKVVEPTRELSFLQELLHDAQIVAEMLVQQLDGDHGIGPEVSCQIDGAKPSPSIRSKNR